jgi:hypothetical protein
MRFDFGRRLLLAMVVLVAAGAASAMFAGAIADEGGVPFWLSGQFGSLAAAPQTPGWSLAVLNYYTSIAAAGKVAAAREVTIGKLSPTVSVNLNVNLKANADVVAISPGYVFATPVFGGQLAVNMAAIVAQQNPAISGTLTASVGPLVATREGSITDSATGFGDLYPQMALRWNAGVHNWMVYAMGDIPVGEYNSSNLANLGIGHGALDGGGGYTYFDPKTGHEFSVVTGLTGNFSNPSTGYTNGTDWHVDWGASQFLSPAIQVGAVGYFYQQITPDQGAAAFLGSNESRVAAIGPQVGFIIPAGSVQAYLNVKGYWEFAAENRSSGWNAWVALALSPSTVPSAPPVVRK